VELGGAIELHAAFRKESRTSLPSASAARRNSGKPDFPVELGGAIELHAAFRKESRNPLPSAMPRAGNSGTRISCGAWWCHRTACGFPVKKAAHHCPRLVPRAGNPGNAKKPFVVFSQGKPHLADFRGHSNCETALKTSAHSLFQLNFPTSRSHLCQK